MSTENTNLSTAPIDAATLRLEICKMFVTGVSGTLFVSILQKLRLDAEVTLFLLRTWTSPDWPYTRQLLLSYGYALCILTYFFVSGLRLVPDNLGNRYDLRFAAFQSLLSFFAIYELGFIDFQHRDFVCGHSAAGGAMGTLAVVAYFTFRDHRDLQCARVVAAVAGIASAAVPWLWPGAFLVPLLLLCALCWAVWDFSWKSATVAVVKLGKAADITNAQTPPPAATTLPATRGVSASAAGPGPTIAGPVSSESPEAAREQLESTEAPPPVSPSAPPVAEEEK